MFFRRRRQTEEDDIIEGEIEDISEDDETLADDVIRPAAPRQRRFFRRATPAPTPTVRPRDPDQPLERVAPDVPTPQEVGLTLYEDEADEAAAPARRWRLPQLLAWGEVRPDLLIVALGLIAGGLFWTLHNRGQTDATLEEWWPASILAVGIAWALWALIQRRPTPFLAAMTLIGISISLLLDVQAYLEWHETLIGIALITLGVGIMARGLLLRQGTVAQ